MTNHVESTQGESGAPATTPSRPQEAAHAPLRPNQARPAVYPAGTTPQGVTLRWEDGTRITEALEMVAGAKLEWHDIITGDIGTEYFATKAQAQEFWNAEFRDSAHPFGGAIYIRNPIGEWRIDH